MKKTTKPQPSLETKLNRAIREAIPQAIKEQATHEASMIVRRLIKGIGKDQIFLKDLEKLIKEAMLKEIPKAFNNMSTIKPSVQMVWD